MNLKDLNGSPVMILAVFIDDIEKLLCLNLEHPRMNKLSFIGGASLMSCE
jgi:hypothetical protein